MHEMIEEKLQEKMDQAAKSVIRSLKKFDIKYRIVDFKFEILDIGKINYLYETDDKIVVKLYFSLGKRGKKLYKIRNELSNALGLKTVISETYIEFYFSKNKIKI